MNSQDMESKTFIYAFIISFLIHAAVISGLSSLRLKIFKKELKQIEVIYQSVKQREDLKGVFELNDLQIQKETKFSQKIKVYSKDSDFHPIGGKTIKDLYKLTGKFKLDQKKSARLKPLDLSRKILVPLIKSEKITNPKYLSYNQQIRQKIRQKAYTYVDHPDFEMGEVYLTFSLLSSGALKQIKIMDHKTNANEYLRNVGLRSIREANPFPAFPSDLNYPELTFNVIISFEIME